MKRVVGRIGEGYFRGYTVAPCLPGVALRDSCSE
jgi:hypothetical protein